MRRWLATPLVLATLAVDHALAQAPAPAQGNETPQSFAMPSFVGILLMIIVMVIVCMPSRKRPRVDKNQD